MRKQLLKIAVLCAACLVIGAQAQNSKDPSGSSSSSGSTPGSSGYSGSSSSQSGWTGRTSSSSMGHQEFRASQLTGAQIMGSSSSEIGTISDLIINPGSGRIDFAVISLNSSAGSSGGATSPSSSSSSTGSSLPRSGSSSSGISSDTTPSSSSAVGGSSTTGGSSLGSASSTAGGKQVAVPWMLLRPSSSASAATSSTSQASFVFAGDTTKLQSAPSFDATTDLSQPGWRHSVFSYFGISGSGSATGGAETPGGSSGSSSLPDSGSGTPK